MGSSKIIECVYEDGVFKPLEKVDLKQGTRLLIKVGRTDLSKYWGILGKASAEKLAEFEGEAQL
jgi:predicted DNA-binding antitoxin AbrB/MazE fold protein